MVKKEGIFGYTEVKFTPKHLETPAWVVIFTDHVATLNMHGKIICFLIKSKESAESYNQYFDLIWGQSKA
ncbi:MAG: hypothetical protein KJ559_03310 [Nanoarchaeota archaeon]|nr:hypothetical protein [Nanoarchaeota archaeon]